MRLYLVAQGLVAVILLKRTTPIDTIHKCGYILSRYRLHGTRNASNSIFKPSVQLLIRLNRAIF